MWKLLSMEEFHVRSNAKIPGKEKRPCEVRRGDTVIKRVFSVIRR
jgi:hypothetical protein